MNRFKNININYPLLAIILFFAIIYCLTSLVNHYNFRTYGFDLGLFNNAIYDYAHFKWNNVSLLLPNLKITNTLGDHFSLLPMLISPFYWIFGSYTLLIFQIAGILWGGFGVFTFVKNISDDKKIPYFAMIHFFLMWGIYSALSFDYHDNVMAAMFVPWFINFIHQKKYKLASLYFILVLISKENMALWMVFICIGLALHYFKDKTQLKTLSIFSVVALIYFVFVIKVAIPHIFGENEGYIHLKYSALGQSFTDYIKNIITRPWYVFKLLFINNIDYDTWNGIKAELHYVVLLSGGVILLYKPQYLIMLLPIYAQKLFSDDVGKWGINAQYSIEFAPILTIAVFTWLCTLKRRKLRNYLVILVLVSCALTTGVTMDSRLSKWYKADNNQFYTKKHRTRDFDVKKIHEKLKTIPKDAKVSAQSMLVPHLAFRDEIYSFPYIDNADYIVLLPVDMNKYPLKEESYNSMIEELRRNQNWKVIYEDNELLFFKRQ